MSRNQKLYVAGVAGTSMLCSLCSNIYQRQEQKDEASVAKARSGSNKTSHFQSTQPSLSTFDAFKQSLSLEQQRPQILATSAALPEEGTKVKINDHPHQPPSILFLGTGSSTGCPKPLCALLQEHQQQNQPISSFSSGMSNCRVSQMASQGNPKYNKNYRNNPSILISHRNNDDSNNEENDDSLKHVVIDVGKTFREGALRWMPKHNTSIDAIVLTHGHFDAIGGLDDVRGFQGFSTLKGGTRGPDQKYVVHPTQIYLSDSCYKIVAQQFCYLVPKDTAPPPTSTDGEASKHIKRHVASLEYNIITPFQPFLAAGLKIIPLPVMHGEDLICLGFAFSIKHANQDSNISYSESNADMKNANKKTAPKIKTTTNVVYLSDISRIIPSTESYIMEKLPPTDILVIDSLLKTKIHPTHYSLEQAIQLAKRLGAKQTYVVGMNCDAFPPHDEMNEELAKLKGINIQLAHDGLFVRMEDESL